MKKAFVLIVICLCAVSSYGKKVKFSVDMIAQTPSALGVHVAGDFQTLAGFSGGDWEPTTTKLTQEDTTSIYSVVVDIPAGAKYTYKFINGDQWYDVEFVPEYSRVGYDFDDNRWTFIDSTSADTTLLDPVLFGGNAPKGMFLVRYYVDMNKQSSVSSKGVHLAGDFNDWRYDVKSLYSFGSKLYEIIYHLKPGVYNYKFVNGALKTEAEVMTTNCASDGARSFNIVSDTLLTKVCFGECVECAALGIDDVLSSESALTPNPMQENSVLKLNIGTTYDIAIRDLNGKIVRRSDAFSGSEWTINKGDLANGVYVVIVKAMDANKTKSYKLVIN